MVNNSQTPRKRGRPREFEPDEALDKAALLFWQMGYEGADTQSLANAMGLSKPSVYAAFGDKRSLFIKALGRYSLTIGSEPMQAFRRAENAGQAVTDFFVTAAETQGGARGAHGCLMACVAAQCAESMADVREFYDGALQATDRAIAMRLRAGVEQGQLPPDFPWRSRARLMTDLQQAMALRARAGANAHTLDRMARDYAQLILAAEGDGL